MARTSKKKTNEMVQGNEVAAFAPVTGVVYNTEKVAKFNTALPTKNDGGPLCFIAVTVFKESFEDDIIDQLEAVLENVEEYNKRKHIDYKEYLAEDCDHIQISGHLVTNTWEDKKKNKHTNIEIVADMIDIEGA